MTRTRVSTTVDAELLEDARTLSGRPTDSTLIDTALRALVSQHRRAEIDATYAEAYEKHPMNEPDEWGDLESFRVVAGAS